LVDLFESYDDARTCERQSRQIVLHILTFMFLKAYVKTEDSGLNCSRHFRSSVCRQVTFHSI